jgi:hypothetical protein
VYLTELIKYLNKNGPLVLIFCCTVNKYYKILVLFISGSKYIKLNKTNFFSKSGILNISALHFQK